MNSLATFLESDAFFGVLIVLLVVLVGVFIFVIINGKKKEKHLKEQKNKNPFDGGEEIKILKDEDVNSLQNLNFDNEFDQEIQDNSFEEQIYSQEESEFDDTEIETPKLNQESVLSNANDEDIQEISIENLNNSVSFDPIIIEEEEDYTINEEKEEETSEIENINEEESELEEIKELNVEEKKEEPKEEPKFQYTSEKTEVFDFPDFSDIVSNDTDILNAKLSDLKENIDGVSEEVIKAADKYIEEIMRKEEE